MEQGQQAVIYEDFSKGEYGNIGGREAGKRGSGFFTAKNLVLYRNGLLGPRAGLKANPVTGLPNGFCWGLGFNGTPGWDLWIVIGTGIYQASMVGGAVTLRLAMAVAPNRPILGQETVTSYTHLTNSGDKVYRILHAGATPTAVAIAGSPGGDSLAKYEERLMVGGRDSARVYYSDAANFDSWPALNYFDVGHGHGGVAGLYEQRGHLAIAMSNGEWWVLTGVPGVNDTLRRITGAGEHPWVFHQLAGAVLASDDIAYFALGLDTPMNFNGTQAKEERHLSLISATGVAWSGRDKAVVVKGHRSEEHVMVLPDYKRMMLHRHGVYTFHSFENGAWPVFATSDGQGHIGFASQGGAGSVAQFYNLQLNLERPAFVSDIRARPGDLSDVALDAYVSFPEWWTQDGREAEVRTVIVDFFKWDIGGGNTCRFDVEVEALHLFEEKASKWSASQRYDEPGQGAFGQRVRRRFNVGDQGLGAGFQLHLSDIRGVAIERVTVLTNVAEQRHG